MLDDLADMGYVVAELASWVSPTSAELAQAGLTAQASLQQVAQGTSGWLGGSLGWLGGSLVVDYRVPYAQASLSQPGSASYPYP